jgi:formylglycine-generating enzyme required for sulfatase activity
MKKSMSFLVLILFAAMLSGCIISATPKDKPVVMSQNQPTTFTFKVFPGKANFTWMVDGVEIAGVIGNSFNYAPGDDEKIEHIISVNATSFLGKDNYQWSVYCAKAAKSIDSAGGTIEVSNPDSPLYQTKVEIPPNTLGANTVVTINDTRLDSLLPKGIVNASPLVELGPDGAIFNNPVYVTLPYADANNDGIIDNCGVSVDQIQAMSYNTQTGKWEPHDIISTDTQNHTVTFSTTHFCANGLFCPANHSAADTIIFTIDGLDFSKIPGDFVSAFSQGNSAPKFRPSYLSQAIAAMNLPLYSADIISFDGLPDDGSPVPSPTQQSWNGDPGKTIDMVKALRSRLQTVRKENPCRQLVIVTHSWGTILGMLALAYDVDKIKPDSFLTLSSPLGTSNVDIPIFDPSYILDTTLKGIISSYTNGKINDTFQAITDPHKDIYSVGSYVVWGNYWAEGDLISGPFNQPNIFDLQVDSPDPLIPVRNVINTIYWHAITSLSWDEMYTFAPGGYVTDGQRLIQRVKDQLNTDIFVSTTTNHISDPNLEAAVRLKISKPTGRITCTDLQMITDLTVNNVGNLNGLECCTNLQTLGIYESNITDLTPLSNLTNLQSLSINSSTLTNLAPLQNLTNLTSLDLTNDQITDISPLMNLINLKDLVLGNNQIDDLGPLMYLPELNYLYLDNNQITDIGPLVMNQWLSSGATVSLGNNPLNDESYSTDIPQLIARGVIINLSAPPVPANLSVVYQSATSTNYLTWDNMGSGLKYQVYWDTMPGITKSSAKLTLTHTNDYAHSGVGAGYTYYYRVCSINATGQESDLSEEVYVTVTNPVDPISQLLNSMVYIPAGTFQMGSTDNEYGFAQYTTPVHTVTLQGFDIGAYEVTQAQYQAIMGSNPSHFQGMNIPVDSVTWYDAREFCTRLSTLTGRTFTLPSEAQWEYACRAGTTTLYSWGDSDSLIGDYAWWYNDSDSHPHTVGTKLPNPWGLYDMQGNVWEWCLDSWHSNYVGAPTDGSAWEPETGSYHMFRGSSWATTIPWYFRSAIRSIYPYQDIRYDIIGFRVVEVPEGNLNNGLVAYYPFNGNANDMSGNGNNGTVCGATLTTDRFGNPNSAYYFNGVDSYIDIPDNSSLNPQEISISAWVNTNDISQMTASHNHHIIVNKENQYEMAMFGQNFQQTQMGDIGYAFNSDWTWYGANYFPQIHYFFHVVIIYDQNRIGKIYVNGTKTSEHQYNSNIVEQASCLRIGARGCGTGYSAPEAFFNGIIDDVRIYNRALTDAEIQQLASQ